jgi:hypothetical protein
MSQSPAIVDSAPFVEHAINFSAQGHDALEIGETEVFVNGP